MEFAFNVTRLAIWAKKMLLSGLFDAMLYVLDYGTMLNFTTLNLKPSFLFIQKRGDLVRFPTVCCEYVLLPLVSKEAISVNGLAE